MKFSSFSENVITAEYKHGSEVVNLEINIDAFTPDYFRQLEARAKANTAKQKPKGREKKTEQSIFADEILRLEMDREINAEALCPNVLKGWDLTEDDGETPVRLNKESLLRLPPRLVAELLTFCVEQSRTVKKKDAVETSENMQGGSVGLHVVGQAS